MTQNDFAGTLRGKLASGVVVPQPDGTIEHHAQISARAPCCGRLLVVAIRLDMLSPPLRAAVECSDCGRRYVVEVDTPDARGLLHPEPPR